jgi:hypothetical protein
MSADPNASRPKYLRIKIEKPSFDPNNFPPPPPPSSSLGAAEKAAQDLQKAQRAADVLDKQHNTPFYISAAQEPPLNDEGDSEAVMKERKIELQTFMKKVDDNDEALKATGAKLMRNRKLKKNIQDEYDIKLKELQYKYDIKLRELEVQYQIINKKRESLFMHLDKMAKIISRTRGGKKRKTKKRKTKKRKTKKHKTKKTKKKTKRR